MGKEYIYIMTNPALSDMIIIGCSENVEKKRKELSTFALPYEYEVYATYEISDFISFKKLQMMIDYFDSKLRVSGNRDFYRMSADNAYKILDTIASLSGTKDKLKIWDKSATNRGYRAQKIERKKDIVDYSDFI